MYPHPGICAGFGRAPGASAFAGRPPGGSAGRRARGAVAVLSIQSDVSYGRVGNRAAAFALERLGHEVWPVDTVRFSNHPAYGAFRGTVLDPAAVRELLEGTAERGAPARCDAVLSGYLGDPGTAAVVAWAVDAVKAANPAGRYCLDPVMGEAEGGLYVRPGVPEAIREHLLPRADVAVPNAFEAALLAETGDRGVDGALRAARALLETGPSLVAVTGIPAEGALVSLAVAHDGAWRAACPRLDVPSYGAGDAFTAIFLARLLDGDGPDAALSHAVSALHAVIAETGRRGLDYLALVPAQAALADPPVRFAAERLA